MSELQSSPLKKKKMNVGTMINSNKPNVFLMDIIHIAAIIQIAASFFFFFSISSSFKICGVSSSASVNVVSCDVSSYVCNYHHSQTHCHFQPNTQPSSAQTVIESVWAQMWLTWVILLTTWSYALFFSSLNTRFI